MYFILALFAHSKSSDVSIHGLWPQYSENSWPEYCTDIKFDLSLIKSLLPELKKHWHSYNGRNEKFWEHEWKKHGTCSYMDEHTYFKTALALREKYIKDRKILHSISKHHTIKIKVNNIDLKF